MEPLPPESNPKQPKKEQYASDAKEDKIETLVSTLVKINQSNRKADNAEHKRTDRREKRNLWMHIVEIILISVYAVFTILEWNVFNTERQTMEKEFLAGVTNSQEQLNTLRGQLNEMKRARELDERAWVFVDIKDNGLIKQDTNVVFQAIIKNTGKTPAKITGDVSHLAVSTNEIPKYDAIVSGISAMLIPNSEHKLPSPTFPGFILEQNMTIYIYGTVWYDDIFGEHHWIQFCYSLTEGGKYTIGQGFHVSCDDMENNQKQ